MTVPYPVLECFSHYIHDVLDKERTASCSQALNRGARPKAEWFWVIITTKNMMWRHVDMHNTEAGLVKLVSTAACYLPPCDSHIYQPLANLVARLKEVRFICCGQEINALQPNLHATNWCSYALKRSTQSGTYIGTAPLIQLLNGLYADQVDEYIPRGSNQQSSYALKIIMQHANSTHRQPTLCNQ